MASMGVAGACTGRRAADTSHTPTTRQPAEMEVLARPSPPLAHCPTATSLPRDTWWETRAGDTCCLLRAMSPELAPFALASSDADDWFPTDEASCFFRLTPGWIWEEGGMCKLVESRIVLRGDIPFELRSTKLAPEAPPRLDQVLSTTSRHEFRRLVLAGSAAPNEGPPGSRRALAEQRAGVVLAELVQRGLDARQVDVVEPAGPTHRREREVWIPSRDELGAGVAVRATASLPPDCSPSTPCKDGVVLIAPLPAQGQRAVELSLCHDQTCSVAAVSPLGAQPPRAQLLKLHGGLDAAALVVRYDDTMDLLTPLHVSSLPRLEAPQEGLLPDTWMTFARVAVSAEASHGEHFRLTARVRGEREQTLIEGPAVFTWNKGRKPRSLPCFEAIIGDVPDPIPPGPCDRWDCRDHARVTVHLAPQVSRVEVHVCLDASCSTTQIAGIGSRWLRHLQTSGERLRLFVEHDEDQHLVFLLIPDALDEPPPSRVVLKLTDQTGKTLLERSSPLEWKGSFPNGKGCDQAPVCHIAEADFR